MIGKDFLRADGQTSPSGYSALARLTEALHQLAPATLNRSAAQRTAGRVLPPDGKLCLDEPRANPVEPEPRSGEPRRVRAEPAGSRARHCDREDADAEDASRFHGDILNDTAGRVAYVLERDRLRVQRILKMASDGIHILDTDGLLIEANDAFLNMLGYDESVIGKLRITDWDTRTSMAAFRTDLEQLLRGGTKGPFETTHRRRDGTFLDVEINVSAIEIEGVTCIYAASRDITERKRVEDQLFHMASTLEQQVNARTSRLREVSAQLAMTEERERRLLAEELHDNLCQLLAVIKIKLTSITADTFESSIGKVVALVDQADQSARLITRELSPQVLHTLGFIPALVSLAKEKRRDFGITMHIDCDREPALLEDGMRALLYRSVRELLTNVGKHARVSEAYLVCRIEDSRLRIIVRDHGCGFDPLQYRDSSPGFHGFGLTSIYERVTNIGGAMTIDSSPGHGTTITLNVPYSIATSQGQPS